MNLPGRNGGPIESASDKDLTYWSDRLQSDLASGANPRYEAHNKTLLDAIQRELAARRTASAGAAEEKKATLAKASKSSLGAALSDPQAVTSHLMELSHHFHVVAPATRMDCIPDGCGISTSFVVVNADNKPGEVYEVGDRFGLSKDTLNKIASAANLSWDLAQTGRLDDGRDPHYVHFRAVGLLRNFDGSVRTVSGEVEIDAREGSPLIEEIRVKAAARAKKNKTTNDNGASQILELRKFILRHAESKAKNRVISDMGVRRSYTREELNKPFAVARLVWTGQTNDPEMRRVYAEKMADTMIGGIGTLYGSPPQLPQRNNVQSHEFVGHPAPPIQQHYSASWDEVTPASEKEPANEPPAEPAAASKGDYNPDHFETGR